MNKAFDLVGVGLNATDTLLVVEKFPGHGGKASIVDEVVSCGGQVASALTAVSTLGLRTKYIGTVGDDDKGRLQMESLRGTGVNLDEVEVREGCPNQRAYIVVDRETGERTIFWSRPDCLAIDPERITEAMIASGRMLLVDGHDTPAVEKAARLARASGVKVTVDVDTIYPGFDRVLPNVDYLVSSATFPERWTSEHDPFVALEKIQREFGMPVAAMTLGSNGVLARVDGRFVYVPGFAVECVDSTGAGDVFHGAFCYSVLEGMAMPDALEFSCAMAALNCTRMGARGGIATPDRVRALMDGRVGRNPIGRNVDQEIARALPGTSIKP